MTTVGVDVTCWAKHKHVDLLVRAHAALVREMGGDAPFLVRYGLPAVDAAACGSPVVAATGRPLPQLLDDGLFVVPGDVAALAAALRTLSQDTALQQRLGDEACRRAAALSWRHGAERALGALREVAA